jgi:hypothetical protein
MAKNALVVTALVIGLSSGWASGDVITSNWIGQDEDDWTNPTNWLPNRVPHNGGGDTFAVTIRTHERTRIRAGFVADPRAGIEIDTLDCYGDIDLEFGQVPLVLADPRGLTNYGRFQISGSGVEHTIVGNFNNMDSGYIQSSHSVELHGALSNAGELFLVPHSEFSIDGNITNDGTIKGGGLIYVNLALDNQGTVTASGQLVIAAGGVVISSGTLRNDPLGVLSIAHVKGPIPMVNQGIIDVNAGGGVTFDCELTNEPNAAISLLGGTLAAKAITQEAEAELTGFGGITGDVLIDPNGIIELTGPTNIVGDVTISPEATLRISDGTTLVTGQTTCNGRIHMKGGRIIPQGGLSGDCEIIWEPGTYTNPADFDLDGKVGIKDFAAFADTWLWEQALPL